MLQLERYRSHPSRVRGLKSGVGQCFVVVDRVAPFTGAWIEIELIVFYEEVKTSRTLHGCVD